MFIHFFEPFKRTIKLVTITALLATAGPAMKWAINSSLEQSQNKQIVNYICRVIEPRLQAGAFREVQDYLVSASKMLRQDLVPNIILEENGRKYESARRSLEQTDVLNCHFDGRNDVKVAFTFKPFHLTTRQTAESYLLAFVLILLLEIVLTWVVRKSQRIGVDLFSNVLARSLELHTLGVEHCQPSNQTRWMDWIAVDQPLTKRINKQINNLRRAIQDQSNELAERRTDSAIAGLASQIAHDIRSPLSALNMIVSSLKELPEDKRLIIRNSAQRINDIANGLLSQGKEIRNSNPSASVNIAQSEEASESVMLIALIDSILSEKRLQYRERMDLEILGDLDHGYGLFAKLNISEFARVISNLVNNSVEASIGQSRVLISIRGYKRQVAVTISDNGKGIPPEVLARLGERGVTYGKDETQSGSGLGVFHARKTIEKAGGSLSIQSQVGVGTIITMTFPRADAPSWFTEKLSISPGVTIISLDDDHTIHQIWRDRIKSAKPSSDDIEILTFTSPDTLENWVKANPHEKSLFLIDYEFLGQTTNGLDVVERLGIAASAIVVTSRFDELHLRQRAKVLEVKLLPKMLAPLIPIEIETRTKSTTL